MNTKSFRRMMNLTMALLMTLPPAVGAQPEGRREINRRLHSPQDVARTRQTQREGGDGGERRGGDEPDVQRETPAITGPLSPDDPRAKLSPELLNVEPAQPPVRSGFIPPAEPPTENERAGEDDGGTPRVSPGFEGVDFGQAGGQAQGQDDGGARTEAILADDDRRPVNNTTAYPWRTVVKLIARYPNGKKYGCSGALIGPKHVLTAGHCVYSRDKGGYAVEVTVIPGLDGQYMPFGEYAAAQWTAHPGWVGSEDFNDDTATVVLNESIGYILGWRGYTSQPAAGTGYIASAGYPKDKGDGIKMHFIEGEVRHLSGHQVEVNIDIMPGQSGSGIWDRENHIFAVASYETNEPRNYGCRLRSDKYNEIREWVAGSLNSYRPRDAFADVNGDGMADAIAVRERYIAVALSYGSGFGQKWRWADSYYGDFGTFFADVDGDRRADAIVVNTNRVVIRRSEGYRFGPPEVWWNGAFHGDKGTYFADIDGDRRADAVSVRKDSVQVNLSNGSRFVSMPPMVKGAYYGDRGTFFADVNGDGRADAVVVNNDRIAVKPSYTYCFSTPAPGISLPTRTMCFRQTETWLERAYYGDRGTHFADVDGDGRADVLAVNSNRIAVQRSSGTDFRTPTQDWTGGAYYGERGTYFADVNGDGRADAIAVNFDKVAVRLSSGNRFEAAVAWWEGFF
jgi:V8-like Glu-specific endopeptidase